MFSSSSSVIFFHLCLQGILLVHTRHFLCINDIIVIVGIVYRVDIFIWVFKSDWVHLWLMTRNCSLNRIRVCCINVFLVFGSWSIFMIVLKKLLSGQFFFMNNGPLKVQVSSFPSFCTNNYLTPLLLSPHTRQFYVGYVIDDEVLGLWKELDWYFWLVFLWMCCRWFGPFWWWKVLPKFLFTMVSIMEWAVDVSTSAVSKISKTS